MDGLPTLDSEFMSTEEQVSVIKNFELTPEFIVNIKISDTDLIERRSKQLLYPENNELYSPDLIQPAAAVDEDEGEEEEEEEEEEEMDDDQDPDAIPEQVFSSLILHVNCKVEYQVLTTHTIMCKKRACMRCCRWSMVFFQSFSKIYSTYYTTKLSGVRADRSASTCWSPRLDDKTAPG